LAAGRGAGADGIVELTAWDTSAGDVDGSGDARADRVGGERSQWRCTVCFPRRRAESEPRRACKRY
jgi:hypothetical protein